MYWTCEATSAANTSRGDAAGVVPTCIERSVTSGLLLDMNEVVDTRLLNLATRMGRARGFFDVVVDTMTLAVVCNRFLER